MDVQSDLVNKLQKIEAQYSDAKFRVGVFGELYDKLVKTSWIGNELIGFTLDSCAIVILGIVVMLILLFCRKAKMVDLEC